MIKVVLGKYKAVSLSLFLIYLMVSLTACQSRSLQKYYSERDNYVNATGTVTYISYSDDKNALYLDFSELIPRFDDTCFKIVGDNLLLVQEKGIDQKIEVGDKVDFITAPRYFGDGYVMPIVAISVNGEELLDFEEGFDNLQKWLS